MKQFQFWLKFWMKFWLKANSGPCGSGGWGAGVPTVPQGKPLAWRLKEGGVQAGLAWPVEGEGPVALRPPGLATLSSKADPRLGRHGGRGAGGPARSHT